MSPVRFQPSENNPTTHHNPAILEYDSHTNTPSKRTNANRHSISSHTTLRLHRRETKTAPRRCHLKRQLQATCSFTTGSLHATHAKKGRGYCPQRCKSLTRSVHSKLLRKTSADISSFFLTTYNFRPTTFLLGLTAFVSLAWRRIETTMHV